MVAEDGEERQDRQPVSANCSARMRGLRCQDRRACAAAAVARVSLSRMKVAGSKPVTHPTFDKTLGINKETEGLRVSKGHSFHRFFTWSSNRILGCNLSNC